MSRKKKISVLVFMFLLSAVTALSGIMILRYEAGQKKEKENFIELREVVTDPPTPDTKQKEPAALPKGRNLAPLYAQNSNFLGWLCIPGTEIDYPVMHTPNEPQKYLRRNFEGEYSASGVPFLDYRCTAESKNLIIYGHNMRNNTMFGTLRRYTDCAYLTAHPTIEWETAAGCSEYKSFAVATVKKTDDWYGFIDAQDETDFLKWIEYIRSKAMLTTDAVPAYGQRLLTLSTCYGSGKDGRLLVVGVEL